MLEITGLQHKYCATQQQQNLQRNNMCVVDVPSAVVTPWADFTHTYNHDGVLQVYHTLQLLQGLQFLR